MALSETLKHLNDCVESDDYAQAVGDVYAEEGDDGSRSGSRVSPSSAGPFRSMWRHLMSRCHVATHADKDRG